MHLNLSVSLFAMDSLFKLNFGEEAPKLPKHVVKDGAKWLMVPSKVILDSLSVWPERQNRTTKILHFMCIVSYFLSLGGQFLYITDKNVDLVSIAYAISLILNCIDTTVRRVLLYVYRERLTKVLSEVYYTFWPSNFAGKKLHKELAKGSWGLCLYWGVYGFEAIICGLQYIWLPFVRGNLPMRTAFPFDWKKSPYYELLYVWQSFLCLELVSCVCALDLFFVSLLFNCVAQFKLLRTFLRKKFEEAVRSKRAFSNGKSEEMKVLMKCIKYHKKLLWVCEEIDGIFTYFNLVQFLTSMGTVCVSSFVSTAQPEELRIALPYFVGHICEILIYCYMGNELMNESTEFSNAIFQCGWHLANADKDLQKSLVMVMVRSQKPVRISAGGFGFLNLPTFLNVKST